MLGFNFFLLDSLGLVILGFLLISLYLSLLFMKFAFLD